jgi:DUF3011 family protein
MSKKALTNTKQIPWLATALASLAAFTWVLATPPVAQAQNRNDTLTCSSTNGRRATCGANTSRGVTLLRELRGSHCEEGFSWGYNRQQIWVDRGCQAEFLLSDDRYPANPISRVEPGTNLSVRTNETINTHSRDGRIYYGRLVEDIRGSDGQVAMPRGSDVELIVRRARDQDLILDLESITAYGQRYAIDTAAQRIESSNREGIGANRRTGEFVGGGAILGSIIGAIAGGGKGAAIGAAAGAAAGAGGQIITRGPDVRVPVETVLNFQLDRPVFVNIPDPGYDQGGFHYHSYQDDQP